MIIQFHDAATAAIAASASTATVTAIAATAATAANAAATAAATAATAAVAKTLLCYNVFMLVVVVPNCVVPLHAHTKQSDYDDVMLNFQLRRLVALFRRLIVISIRSGSVILEVDLVFGLPFDESDLAELFDNITALANQSPDAFMDEDLIAVTFSDINMTAVLGSGVPTCFVIAFFTPDPPKLI